MTYEKNADTERKKYCRETWKFRLEIVGLVVLICYTFFSGYQACLMKISVDSAAHQFTVSNRPWCNLAEPMQVISPLTFDNKGATVEVTMTIRNGGASPAIGGIDSHLVISNQVDVVAALRSEPTYICAPEKVKLILGSTGLGHLILPQETWRSGEGGQLTADRNQFNLHEGQQTSAFVVGCIEYMDQFRIPHGTSFVEMYITPKGKSDFEPVGTVDGHFVTFPFGKAY